eukprot:TRINITY_DN3775_c0_g1_i3.p2 TRINITY_DN3775_c0_g1~~TRINITY_DN3775_c0_g1_i3.p2  ORF type:complete len:103 (+),score=20.13 TRINITY_DN3775_c0_g1_i3:423-731(+)
MRERERDMWFPFITLVEAHGPIQQICYEEFTPTATNDDGFSSSLSTASDTENAREGPSVATRKLFARPLRVDGVGLEAPDAEPRDGLPRRKIMSESEGRRAP